MQFNLHLKSKGKYKYDSHAVYKNGSVTVLKGSKINSIQAKSNSFSVSKKINEIRNNREIVSKDMILLEDVKFNSSTKAGIFVCGYSVNGLDRWKDENGNKLKSLIAGGKNE